MVARGDAVRPQGVRNQKDSPMIITPRNSAEQLFRRPTPASGSNAAKLIQLHQTQALRKAEARVVELQDRLEKRVDQRRQASPFGASL